MVDVSSSKLSFHSPLTDLILVALEEEEVEEGVGLKLKWVESQLWGQGQGVVCADMAAVRC